MKYRAGDRATRLSFLAQWPADTLRAELREYGAWDAAELQDHEQNVQRMLWLAAADVVEQPELYAID